MSRYIDADKIINIIRGYISDTSNLHYDALEIAECCNNAYENIIDELNDLPTEDVKPIVKGEWLAFTCKLHYGEGGVYYKCSNCRVTSSKFYEFFERNPEIQMDLPNYCPVCGAKMERGKCRNE